MATYITKEGDMLDWICWRYYSYHVGSQYAEAQWKGKISAFDPEADDIIQLAGNQFDNAMLQAAVEAVLKANPGLVTKGLRLPAGITLFLPPQLPLPTTQPIRLWD